MFSAAALAQAAPWPSCFQVCIYMYAGVSLKGHMIEKMPRARQVAVPYPVICVFADLMNREITFRLRGSDHYPTTVLAIRTVSGFLQLIIVIIIS